MSAASESEAALFTYGYCQIEGLQEKVCVIDTTNPGKAEVGSIDSINLANLLVCDMLKTLFYLERGCSTCLV